MVKGNPGENHSGGNLKFIGTYRGLFEVSSVMNFEERERFPKELFLLGFPTHDSLQPGTEDSPPLPLTIPNPDLTAAFSFLN